MSGASGATFELLKVGSDPRVVRRLRAQHAWLAARTYPSLVRVGPWVDGRGSAGYAMELLETVDTRYDEPRYAHEVLDALAPVWAEPPLGPRDWSPHLWFFGDGNEALLDWFGELTIEPAMYCGTHGDPTLENLMRRGSTGEFVLIDPVPDIVTDGKVPAIRALDLGKVLQSGLGYEEVNRGQVRRWDPNYGVFHVVRSRCASLLEWRLALWCCAVHVAKLIPYQPEHRRPRWLSWYPDILDFLRKEQQR